MRSSAISRSCERQAARGSRDVDFVYQPHLRQDFVDTVLGELLDIKRRGLAEQMNAVRREFNAEIPQLVAGTSEDAGFELFPHAGKIESRHENLQWGPLIF